MFRLLLEFFFLYLLYRLIKKFLIPQHKKRRPTQYQNRTHFKKQANTEKNSTSSHTKVKTHTDNYGDYIDYEEIK